MTQKLTHHYLEGHCGRYNMESSLLALKVVIDRLAQEADKAGDSADWTPIVRMASCHSSIQVVLTSSQAFHKYKEFGVRDILTKRFKVFLGRVSNPGCWGVVVGNTCVLLSKNTPLITDKVSALQYVHADPEEEKYDDVFVEFPTDHVLISSTSINWMLARAEPLLADRKLRFHVRAYLHNGPTDPNARLSSVWDEMRYTSGFTMFKDRHDKVCLGDKMKEVSYDAYLSYAEENDLLEKYSGVSVCHMFGVLFRILCMTDTYRFVAGVNIEELRSRSRLNASYEVFWMWRDFAPLYGF